MTSPPDDFDPDNDASEAIRAVGLSLVVAGVLAIAYAVLVWSVA